MTPEQQLQIEWQCQRLALQFTALCDQQEWADACRLLTDDAVFARPTDPDNPIAGRAAIQAAFEARPSERISRHLCTNIVITPRSAEAAAGSLYALLYTGALAAGRRAEAVVADDRQLVGEFHDEYVHTGHGWRIAARRGKIIFSTT